MLHPLQVSADFAAIAASLRQLIEALDARPVRSTQFEAGWTAFRTAFGQVDASSDRRPGWQVCPDGYASDGTLRTLIQQSQNLPSDTRDVLANVVEHVGDCWRSGWVCPDESLAPSDVANWTPSSYLTTDRALRDARSAIREVLERFVLLSRADTRMSQRPTESASIITTDTFAVEPAPDVKPNGPFGVDGFRFGGVEVKFGRAAKQYQLVRSLWDSRTNQPANARLIEDVIAEVYGHETDTEDSTFRQLISDTRGRLQRANCRFNIQYKNGWVQLTPL